ncbi:MAG: DUF433 domain-containing protein [Thermoflexibacter sp.]|jgi:uncharacterized protein (DUF433 family)|nr:DUF433 domain-containing protein [Thermoflexibacter sp.]
MTINNLLLERITIDPEICHGKPCIRGMRWPVEVIFDMLSSEMTTEEILEDHPELEKQDILASLHYAKLLMSGMTIKTFKMAA